MAETWSSSRQVLVVAADSYNYESDQDVSYHSAKRTFTESLGIVNCYRPTWESRYCLCVGYAPESSDRVVALDSFLRGNSSLSCVLPNNTGAVQCISRAIDTGGPLVLQYPKYYNSSSVPPNFDVSFRIYSEIDLDIASLIISVSNGVTSKLYGEGDINLTSITSDQWDVRLTPSHTEFSPGETLTVKVAVSDIYGRSVSKAW